MTEQTTEQATPEPRYAILSNEAPVEAAEVEHIPAGEEAAAVESEPEVEQRKEIFSGYTEEELKEALSQIPALRKSLDTTNGTYGARLAEQQKVIDELRQSRQQTVGKLTSDKLSRLSKEFPEIAEMLAEDLSEYIGTGGSAGFDQAQIDNVVAAKFQEVEERVTQKERELEVRTLNRQHRDWKEIAAYESTQDGRIIWGNPEFGKFVNTLPHEEQQQLIAGWDADFIAEKLTDFKAAIKPKVVKKQQIEAAVLPRGVGGKPTPNDIDDEEAAFRAEMARR